MPPKMSPVKPKTAAAVPNTTDLLAVRRSAPPLMGLKAQILAVRITSPQSYAQADALLGRIVEWRRVWAEKLEPVLGPLKEMEKNLKKAMKGAKALDADIDGPAEELETQLRAAMKAYKTEEAKLIAEAKQEQERLQRTLEEHAQVAVTGRTVQQRQKAQQNIAAIESQMEMQQVEVAEGENSSTTYRRMWRIKDLKDFLMGVYTGDIPEDVVMVNTVAMNAQFREHGEGLGAWPGVEVFDDPIIRKR